MPKSSGQSFLFTGIIFILMILLSGQAYSFEYEIERKFYEAGNLYVNQNYDQALELYHQIESYGLVNEDLYYNIGNCYYYLDDIGHAILYYRKAAIYDPDDPQIQSNLELAREKVAMQMDETEIPAFFQYLLFFYYKFSLNTLTIAVIVFFTLGILFLCIHYLTMKSSHVWMVLSIIAAALWIILLVSLFFKYESKVLTLYGVVLPREITVYTGPGENFEISGNLVAGVEVIVLDQLRENWYHIQLEKGYEGFVAVSDIGIINSFATTD